MISEGDIWNYPYLWRWQDNRGETEGRKSRPCALAIKAVLSPTQTRLFFLAITSKAPDQNKSALLIPDTERHRAHLSREMKLWIILDEINVDILEESFYLEPDAKIGSFSPAFLKTIKSNLLVLLKKAKIKSVRRTDVD